MRPSNHEAFSGKNILLASTKPNEYWSWSLETGILNTIFSFFQMNMSSSLLTLSIVRFTSVAFPLWHRVKFTARICRYWLIGVWLFHGTSEGMLNFAMYVYGYKFSAMLTRLIFMSLMLLFTQTVYLASYFSVKKQRKSLANVQDMSESSARATRARLESENNFLTTVAIICLISAVAFIPQLTLGLLLVTSLPHGGNASFSWDVFIFWQMIILPLNFVVNGPIYVWRMKKYRITFKKLYLCG